MAGESLGTTSQLQITIPLQGELNWATSIRDDCFLKIAQHNHQGSGTGEVLDDRALLLRNAQHLQFKDAGGTANDVLGLNASDYLEFVDAKGSDNTKALEIRLDGATASTTMSIISSQTAARSITLPDATTTLVGTDTTDTLTNKTLTL